MLYGLFAKVIVKCSSELKAVVDTGSSLFVDCSYRCTQNSTADMYNKVYLSSKLCCYMTP